MRNQQWRLLRHLQRHHFRSTPNMPRSISKVPMNPNPLSSLLPYYHHNPNFHPFVRNFSTDQSSFEQKSPAHLMLLDVFTKFDDFSKINEELGKNIDVGISHDLVLSVIKDLGSNPSVAIKFFDWVLEKDSDRLSSKSYNLMLGVLGSNGFVKEFWDMVDVMKKKGYGVKRGAFVKVYEKFEKDGLEADLEKLKGLYSNVSGESVETVSSRISKIVRKGVWDDGVEEEIRALGVDYSSELVKMVLEKLSTEPMKCLIFFRWVEESGVFKHDARSYNAMAVVLGREDCLDRFWNVVGEMRSAGHEMEMETYVKVLGRFVKRKMLGDAVSLYEFMMNGANKLSQQDCTFLLRKIAAAKEFDIELFSRVIKAFTEKGFVLEDSMLDAVLKSLTGVGRMRECNKVLEAMIESGFRPSGAMQARVAFDLSSCKMKNEANEFVEKLEAHGSVPDYRTWVSLIEGYCVAGDLENARDSFRKLIEREGVSSAGYPFDMLVNAYCNRDRAVEACKILSDLVNKEDLKPSHTTYKSLISKLLVQRSFEDALSLLGVMKNHGFPPFLDPFIAYLSRRGTADEAMQFFKAMTVKRFPSDRVFLRVFEAFASTGRHREAQNLLAKCPQYIRNNAEVLNLFYSMKVEKPVKQAVMAA